MKTKIEPKLLDMSYLNQELNELFNSVSHGEGDELFTKYRSRFTKEQQEKNNPDFTKTTNNTISVGKKLEILCTYGNHKLIKVDRRVCV